MTRVPATHDTGPYRVGVPVSVVELSAAQARACQAELAALLVDVVEHGASVNFMAPFTAAAATAFWSKVVGRLVRGELLLLAARDETGVVGTAQLVLSQPPNQTHRADVAKVLVHTRSRRQGIARALMLEIERLAHRESRWLLVLDTVTGGAAEDLYRGLGWTEVGSIPDFCRLPTGELAGTTVMFKQFTQM
jgi:GNAT superfamily N-acetyltransferase